MHLEEEKSNGEAGVQATNKQRKWSLLQRVRQLSAQDSDRGDPGRVDRRRLNGGNLEVVPYCCPMMSSKYSVETWPVYDNLYCCLHTCDPTTKQMSEANKDCHSAALHNNTLQLELTKTVQLFPAPCYVRCVLEIRVQIKTSHHSAPTLHAGHQAHTWAVIACPNPASQQATIGRRNCPSSHQHEAPLLPDGPLMAQLLSPD